MIVSSSNSISKDVGDLETNVDGEEEDNVSGEEEDNAGGDAKDKPDDDVNEEEEELDRSMGSPYKAKCDEHSHIRGVHRCNIPHSPNGKKCNRSYCDLCIARNNANSLNQVPYHFGNDMCMVCYSYYKNHLFHPRDTLFTASIRNHKSGDDYPMI